MSDIKSKDRFNNLFLKDDAVPSTNVYEIYASAASRLYELYSEKYELRPRSIEKSHKGTNRGIEFYKDGKHIIEISVGKTTTIYVFDTVLRNKIKVDYNQETRGKYRHTFGSFEECLNTVKECL